MAKKSKAKARKRVVTTDLTSRDAKHVKGGGSVTVRKAGKGQQEYLVVKMNDILISGV